MQRCTVAELQQRLMGSDCQLIDVRELAEHATELGERRTADVALPVQATRG